MARVVRFHRRGGPEVLQIDEIDLGAPGPGEVKIKVRALGLNRAEAHYREGTYLILGDLPSRIGYEAAGVVEAVGHGVAGLEVGDAVSTIPAFSMNEHGVYGDTTIVPAYAVAKHPTNLSWEEAASIWMQYLTAYGAMVQIGNLQKGEAVIITAASSSVGLAAIQIANRLGAIAIAVTRTREKKAALLGAGAAHVIVSDEEDVAGAVMEITGNRGARMVFDPVCGPGVEALASAVSDYGIMFLYGALAGVAPTFPLYPALQKNLTLRGYTLFAVTEFPECLARAKKFVLDGLASGDFKPIIARTFPFEEIVAAHRYLESNEQFGKVVVSV